MIYESINFLKIHKLITQIILKQIITKLTLTQLFRPYLQWVNIWITKSQNNELFTISEIEPYYYN